MTFDPHVEEVLRYIVSVICVATSDDYSDFVQEYSYLDTHVGFGHMKANFINSRLKEFVTKTEATIHGFRRYSWQGRIIIDRVSKCTFSISTHSNLNSVFNKKGRQKPHYLQSFFAVENQKCYNPHEQLTLIDTRPFDYKTFENDYRNIMDSEADETMNFTHYVVAYTVLPSGMLDVDLLLFDSHFAEIERTSLDRFISPDYGKLTETSATKPTSAVKSTRNLVSLKRGIKLDLAKMDEAEE